MNSSIKKSTGYLKLCIRKFGINTTKVLEIPIGLPASQEKNTRHAFHLYNFLINEKNRIYQETNFQIG